MLSMDLDTIANIATIIGATSILITLIFIIIELHKNLTQFRLIREINLRDVQTLKLPNFQSLKKTAGRKMMNFQTLKV